MNVLYITNSIELYGANTSLLDLLEKLQNQGIHPVVLMMRFGPLKLELARRKIKCYIIPYCTNVEIEGKGNFIEKTDKLITNIMNIAEATKIIQKHHIDIIHTNASNIDFGAMLALKNHLPHIWHIREMLYEHYRFRYDFPLLSLYLLHRADRIIAISKYVQNGKKMGKNTIVLYNGFNVEKYNIHKQSLFVNRVCNILYCGMISESKGIMDVVKAVQYMVQSGNDNIMLSIVGEGEEYWKIVNRYINTNHLEQYVTYYGYQKDMHPFREKADIAVISSRHEALGRVTIESMLGEVLVIGADSGGTSELIQDGITGYLYEPGNARQLADRLVDIITNPNKNKAVIYNAKKFALDNFNGKHYAVQISDIYEQCMNEKLAEKKI